MNQKDFKNKSEMQIFLSYFRPHRKLFLLDMVCALAIAVIDLAFPFISRWCMYKLLPDNAWRTFWTVMVVVFCAYILRSVLPILLLTGDIAGKDVVEVYYNPPYTNGGIEKSTANLIGYEKTNELKPGESQTVTISFTAEDMASYDYLENGCYVLEAGDYEISINSDSHNVIDSVTYTVDEDIVYDEANPRSTDLTAAVNQFGYADGHLTYLSRKDGFKNYDETTAAPASTSMPEDLKEGFIVTSNYEMPEIPDAEMPVTGADNGMKLTELRGADYDDERWETLLDQLTIDEMQNMIAHAGFQTAEAKSVEKSCYC